MTALGAQIRDIARARDPESTFSGEELWNLEADWRELDYTWNWGSYRDCQAFTSAFPAPRVSCNVSSCPITATRAFLDNLYLNVFPRKAGSVNGSDWIESYPDLSASLRRCAALRRSFLRYFVDGVFVGDCVLRAECAAAHVSAYVLAEGVLVMAMNLGAESPLGLELDLEPWLAPGPSGYQMSAMDDEEAPLAAWVEPGPAFRCTTPPIGYGRVWVCEVRPATA